MLVKVNKKEIVKGLGRVAGIVAKANAENLSNVWLKTEGSKFYIMGTDSNQEFLGKYPADVQSEGFVGCNAKKLYSLVSKLGNDAISFEADEKKNIVMIKQGRRRYKLAIQNKEYFPGIESINEDEKVECDAKQLRDSISKVSFAISPDANVGGMNCLKITAIEGGHVELLGFNGNILSVQNVENPALAEALPEGGVLIPLAYVNDVKKWMDMEEVVFQVSDGRIFFQSVDGNEALSIPRTYAEYPQYKALLEKSEERYHTTVAFERKDMLEVLDRLSLFNSEQNKGVKFVFNADDVAMESLANDGGEAKESVKTKYKGQVEKIVLNSLGFIEILRSFVSEEVTLHLSGENGLLYLSGEEDGQYMVLTMPAMIQEESYYEDEEAYDQAA